VGTSRRSRIRPCESCSPVGHPPVPSSSATFFMHVLGLERLRSFRLEKLHGNLGCGHTSTREPSDSICASLAVPALQVPYFTQPIMAQRHYLYFPVSQLVPIANILLLPRSELPEDGEVHFAAQGRGCRSRGCVISFHVHSGALPVRSFVHFLFNSSFCHRRTLHRVLSSRYVTWFST